MHVKTTKIPYLYLLKKINLFFLDYLGLGNLTKNYITNCQIARINLMAGAGASFIVHIYFVQIEFFS